MCGNKGRGKIGVREFHVMEVSSSFHSSCSSTNYEVQDSMSYLLHLTYGVGRLINFTLICKNTLINRIVNVFLNFI